MNKLSFFYNEIISRYQKKGIPDNSSELKNLINDQFQLANKKFLTLPKPRVCSKKAYISIWINQEISNDIAKKSVTSINNNQNPNDLKEVTRFYKNELYRQLTSKTKKSVLAMAKQDFIKVIKERNLFAQNRGYDSRIEMILDVHQIPQKEYINYIKNIDTFIIKSKKYINKPISLNQKLPNICFICQSKQLHYKNLEEFVSYLSCKYPFYKKNKEKIHIVLNNFSDTVYIKENDTFQININKNIQLNHQILDLIHEIGHVYSMSKIFKQNSYINPKKYFLEKLAIKNEIKLVNKYLPEMIVPKIKDVLVSICQTLFEINISQNPNLNPDELYYKLLNKCFTYNKNKKYGYLFNQKILFKDFSQLTYSIAYSNMFDMFFKHLD